MYINNSILEIDLKKISQNYQVILDYSQKFSSSITVSAVVKTNSYGLGMIEIANKLYSYNKCNNFFVATLSEAIILRQNIGNEPYIYIFAGIFENEIDEFLEYNLIPVLNNLQQIKIWNNFAINKNIKLSALLHFNTGLNRFSMSENDIEEFLNNEEFKKNINILYIISHLAAGDNPKHEYNNYQLIRFQNYLSNFTNVKASLIASGIFCGKQYYFDMLRPGAAIYGIGNYGNLNIQNPVKLLTKIIHIQYLKIGEYIGYDMTFVTKRDTIIATIPLGYGDGYMRQLSNIGNLFIDNIPVKIVGRISMDFITIDVTDIGLQNIFLGKNVEVIGDNCTPDNIGSIINSHGREITCYLGNRYKRIYKC